MVRLAFDVSGIQRLTRKLERFRDNAPEIAGREIVRQVREYAASGVAPDGQSWREYSPGYKKIRLRKGLSISPVNKKVTGQFLASVKNRNGVIAPDAANMAKAQGMEKRRVSFKASPLTGGTVERLLLNEWNADA